MTFKKMLQVVIAFSAMCLLSGCNLMVLQPKGMIALKEYHILIISVVLMLLVVIPVIVMALLFSWRYRESNASAVYKPEWAHSVLLEVIWWSIPCAIIATLATITWTSSHELDPFRPIQTVNKYQTLKIQTIALNWKWLFIYPDQNIATVNYVHVPVGVPVEFQLTSDGVMNSFLIPQLAGQIYAMAGMQSKLNLIADEVGDYQGFSSNFSGEGFSGMKFTAHVGTQKEFDTWVASVKQSSLKLGKDEFDQLTRPSQNVPVTYYAEANRYLFQITVMKSMMPEKDVLALCKQRSWV